MYTADSLLSLFNRKNYFSKISCYPTNVPKHLPVPADLCFMIDNDLKAKV